MADQRVAVVDIGSNSGRVVVIGIDEAGHLQVLANGRAPLRLARDLGRRGRITEGTIERTSAAVRDFRAIGESAGAQSFIALATSAVRESNNAEELLSRIENESGVEVRVIEGDEEARYTFMGAIHGLAIQHGVVADLGGGSVELTRFRRRSASGSWTLPLGSLRLSERFLVDDPPSAKQIASLARHARSALEATELTELARDERLVGTGGTIRNLAKIDHASGSYPIPRLHGYVLSHARVQGIADHLASLRASRRRLVRGLSRERADSIVGGGFALLSVMQHVGATELTVSSHGLREGAAIDASSIPDRTLEDARRASVRALASRFSTWAPDQAERRALIATTLLGTISPDADTAEHERLAQAATLLDIGRSVDYYSRFDHTADMITEADLDCFSHRKLALLSAVVRQAGNERMSVSRYRPLLGRSDAVPVSRLATLLALADEIEHRLPPERSGELTCRVEGKRVLLEAPVYDPWRRDALSERFRTAFGKTLEWGPDR